MGWLIGALAVVGVWLVAWSLCRMAAHSDADEAQRNLLDLLAEQADRQAQADDRVIADNLDV